MKTLVCEMCGGNNLLKQEGVYVCQNCKTQYSVEDAKKMMIEGTVDVSGSTVKVDNSAKLDNLYKVARRARDDGNTAQAYKHYEQIQMEDPDNWEPAFFVSLYSAIDILKNDSPGDSVRVSGGRVSLGGNYRSGIGSAIRTVYNCLDGVFDLIEEIQDYDEQQNAVDEVTAYTNSFKNSLRDIIENENRRMASEISEYSSQVEGGTVQVMSMSSQNKKTANEYYSALSNIIDLAESRIKRVEEVVGKRRIDEYWDAHQDEKNALESERESLNSQIDKFSDDITVIPGYNEMVENQQRIEQEKSSEMSSVARPKTGLFLTGIIAGIIIAIISWATFWGYAGPSFLNITLFILSVVLTFTCLITLIKKTKMYKTHRTNVNSEHEQKLQALREKYSRVTSEVDAINNKIAPLRNRIDAIDTELTRPR